MASVISPAHTLEDFILTPEINGEGTRFYDRARIVMQYCGFLRRDPEQAGFDFWWNRVASPGSPQFHDYRLLVNDFLKSDEYNFRFAFLSAPQMTEGQAGVFSLTYIRLDKNFGNRTSIRAKD